LPISCRPPSHAEAPIPARKGPAEQLGSSSHERRLIPHQPEAEIVGRRAGRAAAGTGVADEIGDIDPHTGMHEARREQVNLLAQQIQFCGKRRLVSARIAAAALIKAALRVNMGKRPLVI
jgi:hypothetical protein